MATTSSAILTDPRNKYPTPEFPGQMQETPATEQKMKPRPIHGEESYQGHGRLQGMVALITGADSGIGRAVALAYAREGANVAFTYFSEDEDARETERLVKDAGREVISFKTDQKVREKCERVVDETIKKFGRLDILVNNAGFQQTYDSIESIPDQELDDLFKTNIESFFFLSRAALRHLPPGGSIINTSSIQAFSPGAYLAPYAATKAAIANFTISLAQEAIEHGVRVNAVAPGPVWTPLIPASMPKEKTIKFGSNTLLKRPAQPAELAPVYVFLASDDASYITGEIYGVTGGQKQI